MKINLDKLFGLSMIIVLFTLFMSIILGTTYNVVIKDNDPSILVNRLEYVDNELCLKRIVNGIKTKTVEIERQGEDNHIYYDKFAVGSIIRIDATRRYIYSDNITYKNITDNGIRAAEQAVKERDEMIRRAYDYIGGVL